MPHKEDLSSKRLIHFIFPLPPIITRRPPSPRPPPLQHGAPPPSFYYPGPLVHLFFTCQPIATSWLLLNLLPLLIFVWPVNSPGINVCIPWKTWIYRHLKTLTVPLLPQPPRLASLPSLSAREGRLGKCPPSILPRKILGIKTLNRPSPIR